MNDLTSKCTVISTVVLPWFTVVYRGLEIRVMLANKKQISRYGERFSLSSEILVIIYKNTRGEGGGAAPDSFRCVTVVTGGGFIVR